MSNLNSACPICDAAINIPDDTEESEILTCKDCQSRVVVEKIEKDKATLNKAPEVEEDWGE